MKKGLIYSIIDWIIEKIKYLNIVELFKFISIKINSKEPIASSRFGVDLFIIFKWSLISLFWFCNMKNEFVNVIVWYLIFTNVFTYFYYHTWTDDLAKPQFDHNRIKRRFLNLILSIGFNVFSFAYLFAQPFSKNFQWKNGLSTFQDSVFFSLANSFTTNYNSVKSITEIGHKITLMETVISFVFLTIIISNSIPQIKGE